MGLRYPCPGLLGRPNAFAYGRIVAPPAFLSKSAGTKPSRLAPGAGLFSQM